MKRESSLRRACPQARTKPGKLALPPQLRLFAAHLGRKTAVVRRWSNPGAGFPAIHDDHLAGDRP